MQRVTIRNVDTELWWKARAQAITEHKDMGEFINQCIKDELDFEQEASHWAREQGWTEPR